MRQTLDGTTDKTLTQAGSYAVEAVVMDFDFLVGRWDITHHRLLKPLTGSTEWDEFPATTVARTFFDGAVSIDEISAPAREFSGLSLRLFSPQTQEWTVYWVNSTTGKLQPPVHGRWIDGVSRLFGDDEHDGQPVRATYQWSDITDNTARWEQAFSTDGGQTWETNWVMDFVRTSHTPDGPPEDGFLPKLTDGFDFLPGRWSIRNRTLKSRLAGRPSGTSSRRRALPSATSTAGSASTSTRSAAAEAKATVG
jgi:hypothetical protein